MKTDLRRFAPVGLVLAVLAVLGFIGALLVKGLAAAGVFTVPDSKILDQSLWVCIGVFILGLALSAFLDPEGARKFFVGRQLQYGSNAVIMLLAFIGILLFVNMIVFQYSSTIFTPWDLTEDKSNTLAPETLNVLKALPEPVTVRAYYVNTDDNAQKLLERFKQNSNGKLTYEFINPNYDPTRAQSDGVTRDATIVILMAGRKENVNFASEQELDATIIKLTNPTQNTIYFLTGHGERDTQNPSDTSLTQIKTALQNKNYIVQVLNLSNQSAVPQDAKAVVIAGPQVPLSANEVASLETYFGTGGSLIVMEDPRQLTKIGNAPDPLADMVAKLGITLQDDLIIDTSQTNAFLAVADSQTYGQHPITQKLVGYNIAFFTARSLKLEATPPQEIILTPLALSYPTGVWGETNAKSIDDKSPAYDPASDSQAPLTLAAAAENSATKGRLVVFGDSDFATDVLYQQGFGDMLINAVDWSTQQENLISLTPKNSTQRSFITPNTVETIGSVLLAICIIPLLIVLAGAWAWYSRRRKG